MENGGGSLPSAPPMARRRVKRCPLTIPSVLGKGVDRISRRRLVPDDHDDADDTAAPVKKKNVGLRFGSEDSTDENEATTTTTSNDAKPGGLRFASEDSKTPAPTYEARNSSIASDTTEDSRDTGCCNRFEGRTVARNTVGFNSYMKSVARCSQDVLCSDDCGFGTGCQDECRELHGLPPESLNSSLTIPSLSLTGPGGPVPYPSLQAHPGGQPVGNVEWQGGYPPPDGGYDCCALSCPGPPDNSGQLNFYIMLLLEVFGVLIFFAICTITFWVTLAYHFVKLLVELKNADRNTQVAVAIVVGMLFLAFAICHITSGSSSCGRSSKSSRNSWSKGGSCGGAKQKPETSMLVNLLSQIKNLIFSSGSSCTPCAAKSKPSAAKSVLFAAKNKLFATKKKGRQCSRRKQYSDCEGRAIFVNSRRYAIPTEMKQPPTILVWLIDVLGRYL